jgi:hypothetical protein
LGAPVNGCGQIQVMTPPFCDTNGENRGFGPGNSDGLARRMAAGAVEMNGNRRHGFLRILLSVECRHMVIPEYKKFLIEIRLDRRRVIRAWTCMPVRKEVYHVL